MTSPTLAEQLRDFLRLTVHHRGEARDAYDDAALGYDLFASVWDRTVGAAALGRLEEVVAREVPDGGQVLDVAAGTGQRTKMVLRRSNPARVVALDASAKMLEQAAINVQDPRVEFVVGDALKLPFPDDSFDLVLSSWLLSILDEPRDAVTEMLRVLKPGGTVVYTYLTLPDTGAGDAADWIAQNIASDHNPLTHTVPPEQQPMHHCGRSTLQRFNGGFTTTVTLGKCCNVTEVSIPKR